MGSRHMNSWESWQRCKEDDKYEKLVWAIARFYEDHAGESFTDRQVKEILIEENIFERDEMNMVRPKITFLRDKGFIIECGKKYDSYTDRNVRMTRWNPNAEESVQEIEARRIENERGKNCSV